MTSRLKSHPCCLRAEGPVTLEMEKVLNQQAAVNGGQSVHAERVLELNAEHPIFKKLCALQAEGSDKVSTYAGKGEVEIVQKAVDFITDFNAQCKKPVITPRNRFFQLPEMARQARLKLQEIKERENRELKFEGGMLVWNYEADRLQILFDSIPDDQKRKELKSYGFKWSPRYQAWQRQLTQNAVYAVKRVLNLQNL